MARVKARRWDTLKSERVYATPIFDLHRHQRSHPRRGEHDFFVLEAPAWVNIIPLTSANEVVMVRQFRHGIGDFTLEIPGGMVDPEDPSPLLAARREMREESGYDSADVVELGRVHPNPAIQPNYCYSFVARNVHRVARPRLGGSEETEVVVIPLGEVKGLIASEKITHALVIAAFSFFHVYNPPRKPRLSRA
jgi:ADP-ribose pyrophosphatase